MTNNIYAYTMPTPKNTPALEFIQNLQNLLEANQELNDAILEPLKYSFLFKSVSMLKSIEVKDEVLTIRLEDCITQI
jgi:hypothetical protein